MGQLVPTLLLRSSSSMSILHSKASNFGFRYFAGSVTNARPQESRAKFRPLKQRYDTLKLELKQVDVTSLKYI